MSDRALFAAFNKVRGDVENALQETREKEKKRLETLKEAPQKRKVTYETKIAEPIEIKKVPPQTETLPREVDALGGLGLALKKATLDKPIQIKKSVPLKKDDKKKTAKAPFTQPQSKGTKVTFSKVRKESSPEVEPKERASKSKEKKTLTLHQKRQGKALTARSHLPFAETKTPIAPFTLTEGLPVSERADEIIEAIRSNRVVILCGETGSGKTTQLPKLCLMAGRGETGRIGHTQPRRLAASSVAKRIAEEMKTPLGEVVGFKVRFTDTTHPGASIKLMTDGILLAETQTDPLLKAYDTIIIDEAHERSINIDFLLGYLKRLLEKRKDLKVIVTSATIDATRFAEHFAMDGKPAPVIQVSGRTYPVEVRYRPIELLDEGDDHTLLAGLEDAVSELEMEGMRGDILVFLPGEREIREAADYLRKNRPIGTEILPLFARLSVSEQERIFKPSGVRRVVLSTNVAETSITVPGIRYVIDTGLARVKRYSYRNKVEQLLVEPVSQASANQRAGRCGRVANGICIRLYDELDFNRRAPYTDPEIMRSNLAAVILRAKALKLGDIRQFPFIQAPPPKAFADGFDILMQLQAMTDKEVLTPIGQELSRLPLDPRLARMLMEARDRGALEECLIICSGLSIQDPKERPQDAQEAADRAHKQWVDEKSDFISLINLWRWIEKAKANKVSNRQYEETLRKAFLSPRRVREWREICQQLREITNELHWRVNTSKATYEQIHRSLLAGLLGNIGSKAVEAQAKEPPYLGARGIKFHLWPGSGVGKKAGRWILAAEIVETSRLFARRIANIEPEWVEEAAKGLIRQHWAEPHWEKTRGEVVAMERGTLFGLMLYRDRRVSFAPHDLALARECFIREALVGEALNTKLAFFEHNQRLIREIEELEHKTRRPDVLIDDALIEKFYDELIPSHVCSLKTLETWLREATKVNPKLLFMSKAGLMRHGADNATKDYFPKTMMIAGVSMALTYHFEPGSPRDGVTLAVPLFALNQVDEKRSEWLVPGMVKEKAQQLIKSLPQKIRRHCVPVAEYVKGFFTQSKEGLYEGKSFLDVLASDIAEQTQVPCSHKDFKLEQLPLHLLMNYKVLDESGRQLGMGRSLSLLRAELGREAQKHFQKVAQKDEHISLDLGEAITEWSFGELPEIMEIRRKGQTLLGHPALVDQGESCTIEVFDDPKEAQSYHHQGLKRLFKIALKEQIKFIEKIGRDLGRLQMEGSQVPGLGKNLESMDRLMDDVVDATLEGVALFSPTPNNLDSFLERKELARGKLVLVSGEIVRLLGEIAREGATASRKLQAHKKDSRLFEDVIAQLERLFPSHFLSQVPFEQLKHYPRYLKAIQWRLDRVDDNRERDALSQQDVNRFEQNLVRVKKNRDRQWDPSLEDFRWMIEELRVSLFAQKLRTPMPISTKRLNKVWETLEYR